MSKRKKWALIQLLGEKYILNILDALSEGPKRFADLSDACPNEKTRAAKLRRLEEAGLIEAVSSKIGKRFFVHYKLTEKGDRLLQELTRVEDRYPLEETASTRVKSNSKDCFQWRRR